MTFRKSSTVAVVMGGPSEESEISLSTGKAIAAALREKGYEVAEIRLNPRDFSEQLKASGAEVVFVAVHGLYGEDGRLQSALEMMGVPYTGSNVLSSALCMNKIATKRVFLGSGVPTPEADFYYDKDKDDPDLAAKVVAKYSLPVVIKPASQGSSIGVTIAKTEAEVESALRTAFSYDKEVLVERYIAGQETSVCMMRETDGSVTVWPVVLVKPRAEFYDFTSKYSVGGVVHVVPAPLPEVTLRELADISVRAFDVLGCDGVARTDCMIGADGKCYVLEMNTVPGMTPTSLVPDAARAAGISFGDLCEKILQTAHA